VSVDVLVGSWFGSWSQVGSWDAFVLVSGSAAASTETRSSFAVQAIVASGLGLVASPVSASVAASTTVSEGVAVSPSTPASPAESVSHHAEAAFRLGCESGRHAGQTNINRARSHLSNRRHHVYMQLETSARLDAKQGRPSNPARFASPQGFAWPDLVETSTTD